MELINKKKFAKAALDEQLETFVVQIAALKTLLSGMIIHLSQVA